MVAVEENIDEFLVRSLIPEDYKRGDGNELILCSHIIRKAQESCQVLNIVLPARTFVLELLHPGKSPPLINIPQTANKTIRRELGFLSTCIFGLFHISMISVEKWVLMDSEGRGK